MKHRKANPPKWANKLLQWYCSERFLEEIQGDLHEWFYKRVEKHGLVRARIFYFLDVIRFFRTFRLKSINEVSHNSNRLDMFANFVKTSFRNFKKHKGYAIINLIGLVVGFSSCLFILVYLNDEYSYDQQHQKGSRIYRLNVDIKSETGLLKLAVSSGRIGPGLKEQYPEIEDFVRISSHGNPRVVSHGDNKNFEDKTLFADASFFEVFDFELAKGSPSDALSGPFQVVLTQESKQQYFGDDDALGKSIIIDSQPYIVTGITGKMPVNSQISFHFLISFQTFVNLFPPVERNWFWFPATTYLLFKTPHQANEFQSKLDDFGNQNMVSQSLTQEYIFSMENFEEIHFNEARLGDLGQKGNETYLLFLFMVAIFIVLLAVSNFINMSTARFSLRSKEAGIRKILGSNKKQIYWQFLIEAWLFSLASYCIAIVILWVGLPWFEQLMGHGYETNFLLQPIPVFIQIVAITTIGLLAGLYPAVSMASVSPITALASSNSPKSEKGRLRTVLTVFQFSISSVLITSSIVMWSQLNYLMSRDTGVDKDKTIVVDFGSSSMISSTYSTLKNEWSKISQVAGISFSSHIPGERPHGVGTSIQNPNGETINVEINLNVVDYDFLSNFGMEIIAGRSFSRTIASDSMAMILNEKGVYDFGFNNPEEVIGMDFFQWGRSGKVIGVVRDFNFTSLHLDIEPLSFQVWPGQFQNVSFKITGNISQALSELQSTWKKSLPSVPFNYFFLEDKYDLQYSDDRKLGNIITAFTFLAILIAVLGLFALASFICEQKSKEIAIKKVLGASFGGIVFKLMTEFSKPALFAFVISVYPAYLFIFSWLQGFAYRIEITALYFVSPAIMILLLVGLSVFYQSLKAAFENPVDKLRNE